MKELNWKDKRTQKFYEEAESRNLLLVGESSKSGYKFYKFKECGHIRELRLDKVRDNIFECKTCIEDKHRKEADTAGFVFLQYSGKSAYAQYKCKKCNHVQDFQYTHIRNQNIQCEMCYGKELRKNAKLKGLEIKQIINGSYGIYRFINCGHERKITHSQVKNSGVDCQICFEKKLNTEAKKAGLKIIGKGARTRRGSRKYKFIKCGHERVIDIKHVRQLTFICKKCCTGFRDAPSKIYLLKLKYEKFVWLKLGYSKDIPKRIKNYNLHEDVSVEILRTVDFKDGHNAYEHESSIHSRNHKNKIKPKLITKYITSGINECYPIEMKEILLKELANLGSK